MSGARHFHWIARNNTVIDSFNFTVSPIEIVSVSDTSIDPTLGETTEIRIRGISADSINITYTHIIVELDTDSVESPLVDIDSSVNGDSITVITTTPGVDGIFIWDGNDSIGQPFPSGSVIYLSFSGSASSISTAKLSKRESEILFGELEGILLPENAFTETVEVTIK